MATALKEDYISLQKKIAHFAEQHIAKRDELHSMDSFPQDIWSKMGEEKLLGLSLPVEYGGLGGSYLSTAVAGETLMRRGHNMGICISWLTHLSVSRFLIMGFGDDRQHDMYLRGLASGKITASIAVSEPGRGAHPKHLETAGYRQGDSYILNGEKSYLTNGPMADLFVVVASTRVEGDQKRFTAFLVSKDLDGLSITEPMKFDFFRPSPHGGIVLSNCTVFSSDILGREGSAYEDMVKPFRELEDALMMGLVVGGMERQLELLLDLAAKQCVDPTDKLKEDVGELQSIIHTLRIMAYEAASMLDSSIQHPEFPSLPISFRRFSKRFQELFELLINREGIEENTELALSTNDLVHGMDMGKKVALIKQKNVGEKLLSGKELNEIAP